LILKDIYTYTLQYISTYELIGIVDEMFITHKAYVDANNLYITSNSVSIFDFFPYSNNIRCVFKLRKTYLNFKIHIL